MKAATTISKATAKDILKDLDSGLQPIIEGLDVTELSKEEREKLSKQLAELKNMALEAKNAGE